MEAVKNDISKEVLEPKKSGRGNYERKKRGSYKSDSDRKITIKHYINSSLTPHIREDNKDLKLYPVYVRISLKGKTTHFRSREFSTDFFPFDEEITETEKYKCEKDTKIINTIITRLKPFERDDFTIKDFSEIYNILTQDILYTVEDLLLNEIESKNPFFKKSNTRPHNFSAGYGRPAIYHLDKLLYEFFNFQGYSRDNDKSDELLDIYKSDIWALSAYSHIYFVKKKKIDKDKYVYFWDLEDFLFGAYQSEMLDMFGEAIMKPIFNDIFKLLQRNIRQFSIILDGIFIK